MISFGDISVPLTFQFLGHISFGDIMIRPNRSMTKLIISTIRTIRHIIPLIRLNKPPIRLITPPIRLIRRTHF